MDSGPTRSLLVIADDLGIGPATTDGILHLAAKGIVTGSTLLINSPYADRAVAAWRRAGRPMDLGWHPNLTLDRPVLPADQIPSLVQPDGRFWSLGQFLTHWFRGRLASAEVRAELTAQFQRYVAVVGAAPVLVNTHQHCSLFAPVGAILFDILNHAGVRPYVRHVSEPWNLLWKTPGARLKRMLLNVLGRRLARQPAAHAFPGAHWLVGITDPPWVRDQGYFARWLAHVPGAVVELMCHPGFADATLIGRDCGLNDGLLQRRVNEFRLLDRPDFRDLVARAGFRLVRPSELILHEDAHGQAA